jgi:hypothetical protein
MFISHIITRFATVSALVLGVATTTIASAAAPVNIGTDHVLVSAHNGHHHEAYYIGPKGGDTRKGVYGVTKHLTGAVVPLTYPADNGGFIGPKGGDTRKGAPLVGRPHSGAVIPWVAHTQHGFIGPKGGDTRKGALQEDAGGAVIHLRQ